MADKSDKVEGGADSPIGEPFSPLYLATAIQACLALRDLNRLEYLYPSELERTEIVELRCALRGALDFALAQPEFQPLQEWFATNGFSVDGLVASEMLLGILVLRAPGFDVVGQSPKEIEAAMQRVIEELFPCALGEVQTAAKRVLEMKMDCKVPQPKDDPSYRDPRRALQLIAAYWAALRRIVMSQTRAKVGFNPHPLLPLILSLKDRIYRLRELLLPTALEDAPFDVVDTMAETLMSGEIDAFDEEWTPTDVSKVDRWIEEMRLRSGRKTFPVTHAEATFLSEAEKATASWENRVQRAWRQMLVRLEPPKQPEEARSVVGTPLRLPTVEELVALCGGGEDQILEFKEAGVHIGKVSREIAAMLITRQGGRIFYGVADDGRITGIGSTETRQGFDAALQNSLVNTVKPAPVVDLRDIAVGEKTVFVIIVPPWNRRDVFQYQGTICLRKGTCVMTADPEEVRKLHRGEYVV